MTPAINPLPYQMMAQRQAEVDAAVREGLGRFNGLCRPDQRMRMRDFAHCAYLPTALYFPIIDAWREQHG